jgi:hypothetical protein
MGAAGGAMKRLWLTAVLLLLSLTAGGAQALPSPVIRRERRSAPTLRLGEFRVDRPEPTALNQ